VAVGRNFNLVLEGINEHVGRDNVAEQMSEKPRQKGDAQRVPFPMAAMYF
jgi:hypothetical protein